MIKQRPSHITAAAVAHDVGVSVRTIHRWEQGVCEPTVSQWCAYVLACDIAPDLAFLAEMNRAYDEYDKKHLDE